MLSAKTAPRRRGPVDVVGTDGAAGRVLRAQDPSRRLSSPQRSLIVSNHMVRSDHNGECYVEVLMTLEEVARFLRLRFQAEVR
jgi:hypothetical protein